VALEKSKAKPPQNVSFEEELKKESTVELITTKCIEICTRKFWSSY